MKENYELEDVELLSAYTLGEPGKRTFFLIIGSQEDWLRVWLEKEQLQVLGLAIEQFFFTLQREQPELFREEEEAPLSGGVPSGLPSVELEIDQIALGFDQGRVILEFLVHKPGELEEEPAGLQCRSTLAQLRQLGNRARDICAAGRPRCILCGGPIDPSGHICPRVN